MSTLFGRVVVVELGQEGETGKRFVGLRTSFRVVHTRAASPNTLSMSMWNPNPITLALLDGPSPSVRLLVGYADAVAPDEPVVPRLIFTGQPVKNGRTVEKTGTDRILRIEAQDGGRQYREGRLDITIATPTTLSAVVALAGAVMGIPLGTVTLVPDVALTQGFVASGSARDVLDRIVLGANADWMIRDGVLHVIPVGAAVPGLAPLFSSETGTLIGQPIKRERGKVEIRALLNPALRPGSPFRVVSRSVKGNFIAGDVVFVGDSGFDRPFYIETIGSPIP